MSTSAGNARVLVVDDEAQMRRLLSVYLSRDGYAVEAVGSAEDALDRISQEHFDIVLLDLGLPDIDGLDACREIRSMSSIPIIVVSVREDETDKVAALDAGADDYVTKPFSITELLARIRANLRRKVMPEAGAVLELGLLKVDLGRRVVSRAGEWIHLTPTEYELCRVLATNAGRVVTHRQLLQEVRGPAYGQETPLLRVHMVALRQKLAAPPGAPGHIVTEPGVGYRMLDQQT